MPLICEGCRVEGWELCPRCEERKLRDEDRRAAAEWVEKRVAERRSGGGALACRRQTGLSGDMALSASCVGNPFTFGVVGSPHFS